MCITIILSIYVRILLIFSIHDYGYDAYVNMYYESNIPIYWFIRPTMPRAGEEPGKVMEIS